MTAGDAETPPVQPRLAISAAHAIDAIRFLFFLSMVSSLLSAGTLTPEADKKIVDYSLSAKVTRLRPACLE